MYHRGKNKCAIEFSALQKPFLRGCIHNHAYCVLPFFTKNDFGDYAIPIAKQRPIFLMGPPGIGKTAIMEQIAAELNVGLIAYSMTHHTRQSALGLPYIISKTYGGKEYSVSEYTMSEIIASVYDMIEETGHKEGILFLDEINCVSETLAPSMLQFLQYKTFGRHKVPDGWIVVTAGNPPEYNNSVREFDIVTWDRLKRIDVEPDYDAWKEYALNSSVHPSITTYLDIKKADFYKIETTVDGKSFVTARGWSDLSEMIKLYELHGKTVNESLIVQYLQNKKIAKDFAIYYDLFNKYKSDYQIEDILKGKATSTIKEQAQSARFDERLSLLGLLLDSLTTKMRDIFLTEISLKTMLELLIKARNEFLRSTVVPKSVIEGYIIAEQKKLEYGKRASSISPEKQYTLHFTLMWLDEIKKLIIASNFKNGRAAFDEIKVWYDDRVNEFEKRTRTMKNQLKNVFDFCDDVFQDGQEILILVTELTLNYYGTQFISHYGCDEYFKHSKELLFYERQKEIIQEIENLKFDEELIIAEEENSND